jgi:type I restriction enzyme R subunit
VGDLTDGDKVSFFEGLRRKMLESETLQEQAAVNGEAQFANSPTLHDELMKAAMDGDAAHQSMITQFLNSEALQAQMLALMLAKGALYTALRTSSAGQPSV